jgi:hypothetical protein
MGTRLFLVLMLAGGCLAGADRWDFGAPWLAQNYRHATSVAPGATKIDVLGDWRDVQGTTLAILRKANSAGDFQAALAAAWQAALNLQALASLSGRGGGANAAATASPLYLIAMKDQTIRAAIAWRVEGSVLRYVSREGKQEQVSLDAVDRDLTRELNRQRGVEFALPEQE